MDEPNIVSSPKAGKQMTSVSMETNLGRGQEPNREMTAEEAQERTTYAGEEPTMVQDSPEQTQTIEQQAEETLLAGKYKSVEELEKAYGELQKKLGEGNEAEAETETTTQVDGNLFDKASDEWYETGEVSEATINELVKQGIPKQVIEQYIRSANAEQQLLQQNIINEIGGQQEFERLNAWATNNLKPAEIDSFNAIVDGGDIEQIKFAYNSLKSRAGSKFVTPDSNSQSNDTGAFANKSEMISAISDKRYQNDAIYRRQVEQRIMRSRL